MGIPYTKTATTLSLVVNFLPTVIPSSHPNFDKLYELVKDSKTTEADVKPLLDIPAAISTFTGGNVTVVNGRLYYRGFEVKSALASIILAFVKSGDAEAAKPFERFLEKAFQNPDPRAAADLYEWVAATGLPITPDGDILAWKAVQTNYQSHHSGPRGTLDHSIGKVVEEPRQETDSNPDRTCSRGLHFCAPDYLKSFYGSSSRIVAVTISPTDVVSFPRDYGLSKGRACRLTVVGEVPRERVNEFYGKARVYGDWTAPAPAPVAAPTYSVGQRWRRRNGTIVTLTEVRPSGNFPIRANDGSTYTSRGKSNGGSSVSALDLVSRA